MLLGDLYTTFLANMIVLPSSDLTPHEVGLETLGDEPTMLSQNFGQQSPSGLETPKKNDNLKLAPAVMFLTCIPEVPISNLGRNTNYFD
jgi:hypothetical protein